MKTLSPFSEHPGGQQQHAQSWEGGEVCGEPLGVLGRGGGGRRPPGLPASLSLGSLQG